MSSDLAIPDVPTRSPESTLPVANFVSFFAIALVEFAVPFVAVATLGANSLLVAVLGVARFAPQVLFAGLSTRIVNRYDQRSVLVASEILRTVAFVVAAFTLIVTPTFGVATFAAANVAMGCASVLTAVSIQVMVPRAFPREALPRIYSRLGMSESTADGVAPFLAGVAIAWLGVSWTFGLAALLAGFAVLLLSALPRVGAAVEPPDAPPAGADAGAGAARSSMRAGLLINFSSPPLARLTVWAVVYNFGQCVIGSMLLIALLSSTGVSPGVLGAISTFSVGFAVIGAYLGDKLPRALGDGDGIALFGFGAIASYAVVGIGVVVGDTMGLVLVIVGLAADEFCSGVVLVLISTFRAAAIADHNRAIATAAFRALNLTAVPTGYVVGGIAGLVFFPPLAILAVGVVMALAGTLVTARPVRAITFDEPRDDRRVYVERTLVPTAVHTTRLTVAPLTPSDADDLAAMLMSEALYSVIGGAPESRDAALERIGRWTAGSPTPDTLWINHLARRLDTGVVVGLCQATVSVDAGGAASEATIAYLVDPDVHGQGFGSEMMSAFLERIHAEVSPRSITAHIAPGHRPSERLAAGLGLSRTDLVDDDGEHIWSR